MRIAEIFAPMGPDPETMKQFEPLKQFMKQRGYSFQGQGNYASVFQKNKNTVLKVFKVDKNNLVYGVFDPMVFYNKARAVNTEFVPRFGVAKKITVAGENYLVIPSERLSKHPTNPNMRQAWGEYYSYHWPNSGTAIQSLEKALGQVSRSKRKQIQQAINTLKTVGPKILDGYRETQDEVCKARECEDLTNPDNIMWRGNTPVINDPYANT